MDSINNDILQIDVEEVIRKKNARLLKTIPKFIIRYLMRIIHQDEINFHLKNNQNVTGLDFVDRTLKYLGVKYESFSTENIPSNGRFIFASNHPLGGLDGLVLLDAIGKHYPDVKFVVNDLLMNVTNLEPVFVPVNKHGRQSVAYARSIEEAYASKTQVLFFPAGLCSRKINGKIADLKWQKSFITKATQYQRDIIPIYFDGQNSNFFYNLSRFRTKIGIKANIEMLYLVDEMFKQRNQSLRLIFGKPIPYQSFDSSKTPVEWAEVVRNEVYSLKTKL
jgi:putative hemolysin